MKQQIEIATGVISEEALLRTVAPVSRLIGLALWLLSASGTIVWVHGGWDFVFASGLAFMPTIIGLNIVIMATWLQWTFKRRFLDLFKGSKSAGAMLYLAGTIVDVGASVGSYSPYLIRWSTGFLIFAGVPESMKMLLSVLSWVIVLAVCVGASIIPETVFVKRMKVG